MCGGWCAGFSQQTNEREELLDMPILTKSEVSKHAGSLGVIMAAVYLDGSEPTETDFELFQTAAGQNGYYEEVTKWAEKEIEQRGDVGYVIATVPDLASLQDELVIYGRWSYHLPGDTGDDDDASEAWQAAALLFHGRKASFWLTPEPKASRKKATVKVKVKAKGKSPAAAALARSAAPQAADPKAALKERLKAKAAVAASADSEDTD